jgi:hypothetical protein
VTAEPATAQPTARRRRTAAPTIPVTEVPVTLEPTVAETTVVPTVVPTAVPTATPTDATVADTGMFTVIMSTLFENATVASLDAAQQTAFTETVQAAAAAAAAAVAATGGATAATAATEPVVFITAITASTSNSTTAARRLSAISCLQERRRLQRQLQAAAGNSLVSYEIQHLSSVDAAKAAANRLITASKRGGLLQAYKAQTVRDRIPAAAVTVSKFVTQQG